ncbi:hypothetical protein [Kushneria sp. TE3]|uniref:hypothetical protein n=1 Tax=Kushneria sp. TE3 TaxID=3449832 RepID=UPI003F685CBE
MANSNKTQSLAFLGGGETALVLPDDITEFELDTRFDDSGVRSGETLDLTVQGSALESLDLSGNGRVAWDNSADNTAAVGQVDASGLEGGLEYTASSDVQETIILGGADGGVDVINMAEDGSRFGNDGHAIDTLVGFNPRTDTLFIDDDVVASFDNLDLDNAVFADASLSLEEALTQAGAQDSGDAILPVLHGEDTYFYRDRGPAGLDDSDFVLQIEDLAGGLNSFADRQGYISDMAPAPTGPFEDVEVSGMTSGTEGTADSFVFGSDGAWQDATITNFELGVDRLDLSQVNGRDGDPIDYNDVNMHPSEELLVNTDTGMHLVPLIGVPKYDPGSPIGELNYAMGPEDFLFA